jgi:hypothetical protein
MAGEGILTKKEASILFQVDLPDYIKKARELTGVKFDTYSVNLKNHLIAATYRGSWGYSKKTRGLLAEDKFQEAAEEFLNSDEYRNAEELGRAGIIPRMEAVSQAILDEENMQEEKDIGSTQLHYDRGMYASNIAKADYDRGMYASNIANLKAGGLAGLAASAAPIEGDLTRHLIRSKVINELGGSKEAVQRNKQIYDFISENVKRWKGSGLTPAQLSQNSRADVIARWMSDQGMRVNTEEVTAVKRRMKEFGKYSKPTNAAIKMRKAAVGKSAGKQLIKHVGKILGKFVPGGTIAIMLFGSSADADMIAEKLTQDQMDVLERVRRDVEENGISQTEALIYHQLGAFARSPGTKM